jgi:hypothetical protein
LEPLRTPRKREAGSETIASLVARIKQLEVTIAHFRDALEHLEKRMLLRLRGEEVCRVCGPDRSRGKLRNPPISDLERTFCKAHHGGAAKAKRKKPQRLPLDWEEVERLAR